MKSLLLVLTLTWNPPAEFDRPYDGQLIIKRLPQHQLQKECLSLFRRYGLNYPVYPTQKGCTVEYNNKCEIIMIDKPYQNITPKAVLRHENGHCNGWRH